MFGLFAGRQQVEHRAARRNLEAALRDRAATRDLTDEELRIALSEMPSPRFGSTDARVYAFARAIFREVGPDEASRLADSFVGHMQHLARNPSDAR